MDDMKQLLGKEDNPGQPSLNEQLLAKKVEEEARDFPFVHLNDF